MDERRNLTEDSRDSKKITYSKIGKSIGAHHFDKYVKRLLIK
jgi:hypothetical protein